MSEYDFSKPLSGIEALSAGVEFQDTQNAHLRMVIGALAKTVENTFASKHMEPGSSGNEEMRLRKMAWELESMQLARPYVDWAPKP
jgi:hypothetical protein